MYTLSWQDGDSVPKADGDKTWEGKEITPPAYNQDTQFSAPSVFFLAGMFVRLFSPGREISSPDGQGRIKVMSNSHILLGKNHFPFN